MRDPKLFSKLLEPEVGLVSSYELAAVDSVPTIYNLIIDVGQRLGSDVFGVDDRVGAWDLTMAGVLRRGVGEAVERYALRPHLGSSGDLGRHSVGTNDDLGGPRSDADGNLGESSGDADGNLVRPFDQADAGLPRITKALRLPSPANDTKWIRAQRVRTKDGQTVTDVVLVDAEWVNLPTSKTAQGRRWFGTPSGTASHIGLEAAIDSSLRELIERDAVTHAWNGLGEIERVQSIDVRCRSTRKLEQLQQSFSLHLYRVKSRIGSAWTYVAWNVHDNYAAVGSSLKTCPACAALHACIEALQVGALLLEMTGRNQDKFEGVATDTFADLSERRMSFWASTHGVSAWKVWDEEAKLTSVQAHHEEVLLTSEDVTAAGASHIWVDLTARLPEPVSDAGFRVVKSFIPELLSLPMSEGEPWNHVPGGRPLAKWEPLL